MKLIEFDQVYLEVPEDTKKEKVSPKTEKPKVVSMSAEELQKKLEETQSLHL